MEEKTSLLSKKERITTETINYFKSILAIANEPSKEDFLACDWVNIHFSVPKQQIDYNPKFARLYYNLHDIVLEFSSVVSTEKYPKKTITEYLEGLIQLVATNLWLEDNDDHSFLLLPESDKVG